jgi:hypothetical protein
MTKFDAIMAESLPIISRGNVDMYHTALSFDMHDAVTGKHKRGGKETKGKYYGSHIRNILTAGAIVYEMHDSTLGHDVRSLGSDAAKEKICKGYHRDNLDRLFVMSPDKVNDAWRKYRRLAHFAAGLLLFVNKKGWTRFTAAERHCWWREFGTYLSYVQFFQNFLGQKPNYLRYPYDLLKLPAELGINPWFPQEGERLTDLLPRISK